MNWLRRTLALSLSTSLAVVASASAQPAPTPPATPAMPSAPAMPGDPAAGEPPATPTTTAADAQPAEPPAEETQEPKKPGRGDFDAGAKVRLPSGPDEMGEYATFNWVAVDAKGTYYLLDEVTISGTAPIALIKPDDVGGVEPSTFGGFAVTLDARLPKTRFQPSTYKTDVALVVTGAYMRSGALLLSPKDFPLYVGDMEPGAILGLDTRVKLSSLVDFTLAPVWVYQSGEEESLSGVQLPMSLVLGVGELAKVSADLGVYTGDDYSFSGDEGGRIAAGGSLTVKLGPILAHAGAGTASLLTGGLYPTIKDAFYIDLDVKYVP